MTDEEIAFTMVTGLSGRLYLSGYLDGMSDAQLDLVRAGVRLHKGLRPLPGQALPSWPVGLPEWFGDSMAVMLSAGGRRLLFLWSRRAGSEITLSLGQDEAGAELTELYPMGPEQWEAAAADDEGILQLRTDGEARSARVYEVCPR